MSEISHDREVDREFADAFRRLLQVNRVRIAESIDTLEQRPNTTDPSRMAIRRSFLQALTNFEDLIEGIDSRAPITFPQDEVDLFIAALRAFDLLHENTQARDNLEILLDAWEELTISLRIELDADDSDEVRKDFALRMHHAQEGIRRLAAKIEDLLPDKTADPSVREQAIEQARKDRTFQVQVDRVDLALRNHIARLEISSQRHSITEEHRRGLLRVAGLVASMHDFLVDGNGHLLQMTSLAAVDQFLTAVNEIGTSEETYITFAEAVARANSIARAIYSDVTSGLTEDSTFSAEGRDSLQNSIKIAEMSWVELANVLLQYRMELMLQSASTAREEIESARKNIGNVEVQIEEAAGILGTYNLSDHFDRYAKSQTMTMWFLRSFGAAMLGLAFYVAQRFVLSVKNPLSWDSEVSRLALTIPILFLAYYALREAAHHRDASQRAKEDSVRLRTVRAYTAEMAPEEKMKLRYELGQRVFNEKAAPIIDGEIDAKDATSLLGALTALLGVAGKK